MPWVNAPTAHRLNRAPSCLLRAIFSHCDLLRAPLTCACFPYRWLGVEFANRPDGHFVVTKIQEGSPAGKNIMVGDIVAFIAGFNMRALTGDQMM